MTREPDGAIDTALAILSETRGRSGEIFLDDYAVFSVTVAAGAVESLETKEVRGAGLRLFEAGRTAFTYTSDLTPNGLREAVETARTLLPFSDPDDANRLPEADAVTAPEPEVFDPSLARVDSQDKVAAARRVEEAARAADARVTKVRLSRYTDVVGRCEIAGTAGLRRVCPFSRVYAFIELNAEQGGEQQSGYYADFSVRFSGLDAAHVGREAARRAAQKLGAVRAPSRRTSLVLEPSVAASLMESLAPAFHADNVLKGKSLLAGRVGATVASAKVTLLDDGRLPGADHSAAYDGEGVATRMTMLLEGGVLKGFLHSHYSSVRMGAAPTGNAFRADYKAPPRIAPSNLYLQPTGIGRDALLAEAGEGLYITEVMGLHTIDPVSGDFSLGACGLAFREGRLSEPVDRIGIAGNVLDLLGSVAGVATDLRMLPGGGAGSSTLLAGVSVSGT